MQINSIGFTNQVNQNVTVKNKNSSTTFGKISLTDESKMLIKAYRNPFNTEEDTQYANAVQSLMQEMKLYDNNDVDIKIDFDSTKDQLPNGILSARISTPYRHMVTEHVLTKTSKEEAGKTGMSSTFRKGLINSVKTLGFFAHETSQFGQMIRDFRDIILSSKEAEAISDKRKEQQFNTNLSEKERNDIFEEL